MFPGRIFRSFTGAEQAAALVLLVVAVVLLLTTSISPLVIVLVILVAIGVRALVRSRRPEKNDFQNRDRAIYAVVPEHRGGFS